jgi:hypothetical protein
MLGGAAVVALQWWRVGAICDAAGHLLALAFFRNMCSSPCTGSAVERGCRGGMFFGNFCGGTQPLILSPTSPSPCGLCLQGAVHCWRDARGGDATAGRNFGGSFTSRPISSHDALVRRGTGTVWPRRAVHGAGGGGEGTGGQTEPGVTAVSQRGRLELFFYCGAAPCTAPFRRCRAPRSHSQ